MSEDLIKSLNEGLAQVKETLGAKMAEHTAQIEKFGKASTDLTAQVDELANKFKSVQDEITELAQKSVKGVNAPAFKSVGDEVAKSDAYKEFVKGDSAKARISVKNTAINSDLSAVFSDTTNTFADQRQGIINGIFRPLTLREQLSTMPVSGSSISAIREKSWASGAAETGQGKEKPDSEIEFEKYTVNLATVAHLMKVTKQLLNDSPAVIQYINTRMRDGLAQRIDQQLLIGNGAGDNISGLINSGNYTAFTPDSGDNLADSINKAKYKAWANGVIVDTAVVHPADWSKLELSREGQGTGAYLYGTPGTVAGTNPFGVRIVLSAHIPEGTFLIADLRGSTMLYTNGSVDIEFGYENDDFRRNLVTIRAEENIGLGIDKKFGIYYGDITSS